MSAVDRIFGATLFDSVKNPQGKAKRLNLRGLRRLLHGAKQYTNKIEQPLLSCASFKENYRLAANIEHVGAIVGDHDAGTMTVDEVEARLRDCGLAGLVATSFSHSVALPRWRIVVPISRDASTATHRTLVRQLNRVLSGALAEESEVAAQAWFWAKNVAQEIDIRLVDGDPFDLHAEDWTIPPRPCTKASLCATVTKKTPNVDKAGSSDGEHDPFNAIDTTLEDTPENRTRVHFALEAVPPSCSRQEYLHIGFALCSTGWSDWSDMWRNWASGALHGYAEPSFDEFDFERDAKSAKRDGGITIATLFSAAERRGYKQDGDAPGDRPDGGREDATDAGNLNILVRLADGNLKYNASQKEWLWWSETHWLVGKSAETELDRLCGAVAEHWFIKSREKNAESVGKSAEGTWSKIRAVGESFFRQYRYCRSRKGIDALQTLARRDDRLTIDPLVLDRNPRLLGVQNGVVDLETMTLRHEARDDFVTLKCSVNFDPSAKCDRWRRLIREATGTPRGRSSVPRPQVAAYLQRYLGYACTGLTNAQMMGIWVGNGANGKNAILDQVMAVLGPGYAMSIPPEMLMLSKRDRNPEAPSPMLAGLHRVRLAVAAETQEEERLDVGTIKRHSGGGPLRTRGLNQAPFEFTMTHKLALMTNEKPRIAKLSEAIIGRLHIVPFEMTFNRPGHPNPDPELPDGDPHLAEVLETERTGILNWLVEGAMLYLRDGLLPPSDVTNETVAFLSTQGYFYDWVKEQEVCDPKKGMRAAQLLGAY